METVCSPVDLHFVIMWLAWTPASREAPPWGSARCRRCWRRWPARRARAARGRRRSRSAASCAPSATPAWRPQRPLLGRSGRGRRRSAAGALRERFRLSLTARGGCRCPPRSLSQWHAGGSGAGRGARWELWSPGPAALPAPPPCPLPAGAVRHQVQSRRAW